MNHTAHIFKALFAVPFAAALTFTACSDDWDDHYSPEGQNQISGQSLWEAIESNPELSNFASVVKATGYDKSLGGSQAFSVFAPVNADFTAEDAQSLIATYNSEKAANTRDDDNTTIKEFLQNHIALYNHSVSSETNDSLVMMNGKYQILTDKTFAGHNLLSTNGAYANGVLYTVEGQAEYSPNVFEYLGKDADIDSVANYLYSYNEYVFDASSSVPGDIVNGQTQYLDSVVNLENDEVHDYLGRIDSEDSTYWMVVPTNDVWNTYVPQFEQYFQYDNTVNKSDSLTWANARMALLRGTVFSRTKNTDAAIQDSAMSTSAANYAMRRYMWGSKDLKYYQYDHPLAAGGVFNGTTNVECSNGQVMKASQWNIKPTETFLQQILIEGENVNRLDSINQNTTNTVTRPTVQTSNPYYGQLSNNSYMEMSASGTAVQAMAYFSVPNMLSNVGYDIYVRTAPALAGDTLATDNQRLPVKFRVYLRYQDQSGNLPQASRNWTVLDGEDNTSLENSRKANWETHKDSVDLFKVGNNVKIPYTTYGTGSSSYKVELIFQTSSSSTEFNRRHTHNRTLRIDEILVVPHQDEEQN